MVGVVLTGEAVLEEGAELMTGVIEAGVELEVEAVAEAGVVVAVGAVVELGEGQEPMMVVMIHGHGNRHALRRIHLQTYLLLDQCLVQVE